MSSKKPVYFGKDVVNENLIGYTYDGYFPMKLMLRFKYWFQSGVAEWWENYFKWVYKIKSEVEVKSRFSATNISSTTNSKTYIYILSIIPGVGFLLSF